MTKAERECAAMGPGFRKLVRALRLQQERKLREERKKPAPPEPRTGEAVKVDGIPGTYGHATIGEWLTSLSHEERAAVIRVATKIQNGSRRKGRLFIVPPAEPTPEPAPELQKEKM